MYPTNFHHRGVFFTLASLVFLSLFCGQSAGQSPDPALPWFKNCIVGMEVGPTGAHFGDSDPHDQRYCARWDGAEIVRNCVAAGAEYLVLWLRDGDFAYYNSSLLPKAPGLADRDPLREALEEARKHQLPIISYCVVQQGGICLQQNPQWKMRDSNGNEIGRFCLNSGYLELIQQIVAEQLAYGIEGFHIDMLDQGFGQPYGCWCETCKDMFKQNYGHEMPSGATWDDSWNEMLEFRYKTSEHFEQQLTKYIKQLNPAATVDYNYHGSPPFSFEVGQRPVQHAGNGDFVTGETGVWGFSALGVGLNAEFYRASTPGIPFQVAIQRGVRMYHDQTTRPLHDMRWETLTLLAHGAFVTMIDKTAFDGSLDPVAYNRIGKVLEEAKQKRQHFGHTPIYDIGIYFSSHTRDWWGRENAAKYFQSFMGAHQICQMEHLQYGVILDENLTLDALQRFPVVCMPNAAILSNREVELLTRYVQQGGHLIVTGFSGQFDALGKPLEIPLLETLIGARINSRLESEDNWLSLSRDLETMPLSLTEWNLPVDWPFLVKGPATIYEPIKAKAFGNLHRPHRTKRQLEGRMGDDWPMSADSVVGPAILINQVGEGSVVTVAAALDYAAASEHALVEGRKLFAGIVQSLLPNRRIKIDAPANVEAVVTEDLTGGVDLTGGAVRVHLLAYNPTPRTTPSQNRPYVLPGLIEDKPILRAKIVADGVTNIEAWNPTTVIEKNGNAYTVTVEDVHEVLQLEVVPDAVKR